MRLADGELHGVGRGGDNGLYGFIQVLDALQEGAFIKEAVVDGDIEAAIGLGVEKTIQAIVHAPGKFRSREF